MRAFLKFGAANSLRQPSIRYRDAGKISVFVKEAQQALFSNG
jgi:hypothetical protein